MIRLREHRGVVYRLQKLMGCFVGSWLDTNQAFHAAAREQAQTLATEFGLEEAYQEARRRREQLPAGEAKVFAYNVELLAAEAAGISLDNPFAKPLGAEAPLWIAPFITRGMVTRSQAVAARLLARLRIPTAPSLAELLRVYVVPRPLLASPLTPRQIECLRWAAEGKSSTDIAAILGISAHTVDEHLDNACHRLGVRRRSQAIAKAAKAGMLDPPPN